MEPKFFFSFKLTLFILVGAIIFVKFLSVLNIYTNQVPVGDDKSQFGWDGIGLEPRTLTF